MNVSLSPLIVVLFAWCALLSCSTTSKDPVTSPMTETGKAGGFALVAGTWRLSHLGPASVRDPRVPDPAGALKESMAGTTIDIQDTGKISLIAPQYANSWQATISADSPLFLKIGSEDQPRERDWVYDKSKDLLMMPAEINLPGKSGTIPVYFKRSKQG